MKRFFYTGPKRSAVGHVCFGKTHVEGNKVACGRYTKKGWYWWRKKPWFFVRCRQCDAALERAGGIFIERVRKTR